MEESSAIIATQINDTASFTFMSGCLSTRDIHIGLPLHRYQIPAIRYDLETRHFIGIPPSHFQCLPTNIDIIY